MCVFNLQEKFIPDTFEYFFLLVFHLLKTTEMNFTAFLKTELKFTLVVTTYN